ncbi:MAG: zf-HC2 domain-containing protein [Planctomycetota bacterium]|nr:zf-HC2 domain-containing protein [Planctomycetota bacterium]
MSENVEQIEAKLCGFVDGELNAEERAEIESHLAANPSHRTLIQELIAQRGLLRDLPREGAPGDLSEPLQGQLEREALLGSDLVVESALALRMRRWPQGLAVAAIVLLAIGLGAAVYFVLPPSHPEVAMLSSPADLGEVARKNTAIAAELLEEDEDATQDKEDADERIAVVARDEGKGGASKSGDLPLSQGIGTPGLPTPGEVMLRDLKEGTTGGVAVNTAAFFGNTNASQTLVIMVKAADVKLANDRVVSYLSQNNITWAPADDQAIGQAVLASEPAQQQQQAMFAPVVGSGPATQRAEQRAEPAVAMKPAADDRPDGRFAKALALRPETPAKTEEAPVAVDNAKDALGAGNQPGVDQSAPAGSQLSRQVVLMREDLNVARNGRVILARNVNGQQLVELRAAISQVQEPRQLIENAGVLVSRVQPAPMQPATMPVLVWREGQTFAYTAGVAVPGDMDHRMSDQGAMKSRVKDLAATTQPAGGFAGTMGLAMQRVAENQSALAPTTAPALAEQAKGIVADVSVGMAGPFNCVIVLEDTEVSQAAATTQPTTQPVTLPTTQPGN